jgi:hypothetical protein
MSFFPGLNIDLEHVAYKGLTASKLANELMAFFQEFIDIRDKGLKDGIPQETVIKEVRTKFTSLTNTLRFSRILREHTGVDYDLMYSVKRMGGTFATQIRFQPEFIKDTRDNFVLDNSKDGTGRTIQSKVAEFHKAFDRKEGKLDRYAVQNILSDKCVMWFDVDCAFFINLYHSKFENLAASEITAIVLHEVGHTVSAAEYLSIFHNTIIDFAKPVEVNISSIEQAKVEVAAVKKELAFAKRHGHDKKSVDVFEKVISNLDDAFEKDYIKQRNIWFFLLIVPLTLFFIKRNIKIWTINNICSESIDDLIRKNPKKKSSDLKRTLNDYSNIEYRADAYVSMHGLGPSLIVALSKVTDACMASGYKNNLANPDNNLIIYNVHMYLTSLLSGVTGGNRGTYGSASNRMKNTKRIMLDAMRADDIPKDVTANMLKEYEKFLKLEDFYKRKLSRTVEQNHRLFNFFHRLSSMKDLISFVSKGKMDKDYEFILSSAKKLISNDLIYLQKRVEQQANNK